MSVALLGLLAFCLVPPASRAANEPPAAGPRHMDGTIARKEVFEFAVKPVVTRAGDKVTITFAAKDACDATIAIEDAAGRILRHLASGVLGANAPAPFQKGALKQTVTWDGKNDKEEYVDNPDQVVVRVSLGLQPRLERTLYWSPYKLGDLGTAPRLICAAPEGVYVFDDGGARGGKTPYLKLYDHDGNYVHSLYPFPADGLAKVAGLTEREYPPDGRKFPLKCGVGQTSVLPVDPAGPGATGMAVGSDVVYLLGERLMRIAKPGSGAASDVKGPVLEIPVPNGEKLPEARTYRPTAAAVSPDGKWLYLTGYRRNYDPRGPAGDRHYEEYLPYVARMAADGSQPPQPFIGEARVVLNRDGQNTVSPPGSVLNQPMDIRCDRAGRIYVADHLCGLLVFSPEGKLLQSARADPKQRTATTGAGLDFPHRVAVDPKSGEITLLCWKFITHNHITVTGNQIFDGNDKYRDNAIVAIRFAALKDDTSPLQAVATVPVECGGRYVWSYDHGAEADLFGATPRVWVCSGWNTANSIWDQMNFRVFDLAGGKPKEIRNFTKETRDAVTQTRPPRYGRQRPYFNPADGCVYIAEQIFPTGVPDVQCFDQLVRIDPNTGRSSMVNLPFDAEDMMFDLDGLAYLRTDSDLVRYDAATWREVPFDYGDEKEYVTHYDLHKSKPVSASVFFRGGRGASGKLGGMGVNARGDVACWFYSTAVSAVEMNSESPFANGVAKSVAKRTGGVKEWRPQVYPGRCTHAFVHIWDKHGKLKFEDAVPGLAECTDIKLDKDDNLYLLAAANPRIDNKPYVNPLIGSLIKVGPRKAKIYSQGGLVPVPMPEGTQPKRQADWGSWNSTCWMEGGDWMLEGVGGTAGLICACHCEANSSMALDSFGRSFVPAFHRFDVAVVDPAGNTVVRIGRYGNVEDGLPLVKDGGPANAHSIGGDEVSFVSPKWLAVQSDRRLFVVDRGNYRVACIKLGYHAEEKVTLKDASGGTK
jgi:hypothetical protein